MTPRPSAFEVRLAQSRRTAPLYRARRTPGRRSARRWQFPARQGDRPVQSRSPGTHESRVDLRGPVWDPRRGDGAIARVMMKAGYEVVASDLGDHGFGRPGIDIFGLSRVPDGCRAPD